MSYVWLPPLDFELCEDKDHVSIISVSSSFSISDSFISSLSKYLLKTCPTSDSTRNTEKGNESEQDQRSGEHADGDNQIMNFLPSSPKRTVFQRCV